MKLRMFAMVAALAGAGLLTHAAFNSQMLLEQLEAEVSAQRDAGRSIDAIAVAALEAEAEAGQVAAAMVLAGYTPLSVVRAMLGAGALPTAVCAGLLAAGVRLAEAQSYFEPGVTGRPEACPPQPEIAASPSDTTPGVAGTGGRGGGALASPN